MVEGVIDVEKFSRRRLLHYSALLTALTATTPIRAAISPSAGGDINFSDATFYVPGYRPKVLLNVPTTINAASTNGNHAFLPVTHLANLQRN